MSCKGHSATRAGAQHIAAASAVGSPGAGGLGTACRGFAGRMESKVGR